MWALGSGFYPATIDSQGIEEEGFTGPIHALFPRASDWAGFTDPPFRSRIRDDRRREAPRGRIAGLHV